MKTAEEMFKDLGFKPDYFNGVGNIILYYYEMKGNTNCKFMIRFDCNIMNYSYYYKITNPLDNSVILEKQALINVYLHQAITKKMEELGWL